MRPEISVVVPMRNEAPNVEPLYRATTEALTGYGRRYEIIAIDDGSTDETFASAGVAPGIGSAGCGSSASGETSARRRRLPAGFAQARGRFIVTLDGDMQNDPHDIPMMIDLAERARPTSSPGWRRKRKDPFLNRRLPSIVANRIISISTGVKLHDYGCSLKVFRAEVVKPMKLYGEMHRFLPAIASEQGVSIVECEVNHYQRKHGNSKYGIGADDPGHSRSADGQVPAELFDAAAADFRADRRCDGAARAWPSSAGWSASGRWACSA